SRKWGRWSSAHVISNSDRVVNRVGSLSLPPDSRAGRRAEPAVGASRLHLSMPALDASPVSRVLARATLRTSARHAEAVPNAGSTARFAARARTLQLRGGVAEKECMIRTPVRAAEPPGFWAGGAAAPGPRSLHEDAIAPPAC